MAPRSNVQAVRASVTADQIALTDLSGTGLASYPWGPHESTEDYGFFGPDHTIYRLSHDFYRIPRGAGELGLLFGLLSSAQSFPPAFVNSSLGWTSLDKTRTIEDIKNSLNREALIDGTNHPAEDIIKWAIGQSDEPAQWFFELIERPTDGEFSGDVLRLLCRIVPGSFEWRARVVDAALKSPFVHVRQAGVQAVESWKDRRLVTRLAAHRESVLWLAGYARQVLKDCGCEF